MSLLRLYCSLRAPALRCRWALLTEGSPPLGGDSPLGALPQRAGHVQLVIPAAQTLLTRVRLPQTAKRRSGAVLTFAVEEATLGEPEAHQVSWLGTSGDADVLAAFDKNGLQRWLDALAACGIQSCEVHSEILLLPWTPGEWSLAWDGQEGFVRSGELEGAATDRGDRKTPPLSLRLLLAEAQARNAAPATLALYPSAADALPDLAAWQGELGLPLHSGGTWDSLAAPAAAGVSLAEERRRWRHLAGALPRLRPAAWIVGAALAIHAFMLAADWTLLAREQRTVRQEMEARFRGAFPDAVAVVDPALQMRRKLAEARHAANQPDSGDFLPMLERAGAALQKLPAGSLRSISYESGRMKLEIAAADEAALRRIVTWLNQAGLNVDLPALAAFPAGGAVTLIARVP